MRRRVWLLGVPAAFVLLGSAVWAQSGPWVHVRVTGLERDRPSVNVNLPLSAVEALVELAPNRFVSEGRVKLGRHGRDVKIADLRRIWEAVREAEDSQFVSVDSDDGQLRVARRDDVIDVRFDGRAGDRRVRVEVPVAVVDALLSGDGESLDLGAALAELGNRRGDIVRITNGDDRVHVWIDEG